MKGRSQQRPCNWFVKLFVNHQASTTGDMGVMYIEDTTARLDRPDRCASAGRHHRFTECRDQPTLRNLRVPTNRCSAEHPQACKCVGMEIRSQKRSLSK